MFFNRAAVIVEGLGLIQCRQRIPRMADNAYRDVSARGDTPALRLRWGWLLLLTLLTALPLAVVTYAPLNDFPFHLARMRILYEVSTGGPLSRFYTFNSFLVPNVGMDVVILGLELLGLGLKAAANTFLIGLMVIWIGGAEFLHVTIFRRRGHVAGLLAAALFYNAIFAWGFLNYLLAVALLPWAIGLFLRTAQSSVSVRIAVGLGSSILLYFAHMVGLAVYALIVFVLELQGCWSELRARPALAAQRLAAVLVPTAVMAGFFLVLSPTAEAAVDPVRYEGFRSLLGFLRYKLLLPFNALETGNTVVDIVSGLAIAAIGCAAAVAGQMRAHRGIGFALLALIAVIWITPSGAFGALYIDLRLPVALFLLAACAIDLGEHRHANAIAAALLGVVIVRCGLIAAEWQRDETVEHQFTQAYQGLPRGSLLFAAEIDLASHPARDRLWWHPPVGHYASLATVTNELFVPATWADRGQQPIAVRPDYADLYRLQSPNPSKVADFAAVQGLIDKLGQTLRERAAHGLDDFRGRTYLLLLYPDAVEGSALHDATLVANGSRFALYKLGPDGGAMRDGNELRSPS